MDIEKDIRLEKQQRVRKLYQESGMTYTELAEHLGINRSTLARWLNGTRTPSDETIIYIENRIKHNE